MQSAPTGLPLERMEDQRLGRIAGVSLSIFAIMQLHSPQTCGMRTLTC